MEPTKPKLPSGATELTTSSSMARSPAATFMDGLQRFAAGGAAVATLMQALMPNYAFGQQVSKTDDRIKATYETVPSPQGNGSIKGYFVRPVSADKRNATPTKLPGVIVVHENRGLNPHIEDIARRFALANFMAFAPDGLTSVGGFPGDDYKGGELFRTVDGKKMAEDFIAAAQWLKKARPDCTGKITATGFCYGRRSHREHVGCPPRRRYSSLRTLLYGGRCSTPRTTSRRSKPRSWSITANSITRHGCLMACPRCGIEGSERPARGPKMPIPALVQGFNCDATPESAGEQGRVPLAWHWQRTIDLASINTPVPRSGTAPV